MKLPNRLSEGGSKRDLEARVQDLEAQVAALTRAGGGGRGAAPALRRAPRRRHRAAAGRRPGRRSSGTSTSWGREGPPVSRRVFVHIGLPKTGTSYLQAIAWPGRERLREAGLLLPGARKSDHLLSSMIVRDDPGIARRGPDAPRRGTGSGPTWPAGRATRWSATSSSARPRPSRRSGWSPQLAPAEVHVVITAREPLGLFTSSWQESLKNKSTTRARRLRPRGVRRPPRRVGLARPRPRAGAGAVGAGGAPERLHVITPPPPGSPREVLWERFAGVLGIDPATCDAGAGLRQLLDGRGGGRDAAPGQRAAHRLQHRPRARRVAALLPRRRAAGAAPRGAVLARRRPGGGRPGAAASGPWSGCAPRRTTWWVTWTCCACRTTCRRAGTPTR